MFLSLLSEMFWFDSEFPSCQLLFGSDKCSPSTQGEFDSLKNTSAKVVQSWIDNSSPPGIIAHVGTKETVQDLEAIRVALGYDKINFVGSS